MAHEREKVIIPILIPFLARTSDNYQVRKVNKFNEKITSKTGTLLLCLAVGRRGCTIGDANAREGELANAREGELATAGRENEMTMTGDARDD